MEITDRVWGKHEITEPALIDLIESGPVKRLQNISHYGIPPEFYAVPGFSRYEHSVGVMLALRTLGASTEEQAAGLLHDVSHTTFSHVVDFIFSNKPNDDYQDNRHREVIEKSELPDILRRHGLPVEPMITMDGMTLLEYPAPDMCADRLDYAVREFEYWLAPHAVRDVRNGLTSIDGKIVFNSFDSASIFARQYMKLQKDHWAGIEAVGRYHLFSQMLEAAFKENVLVLDDLNGTDDQALCKLKASSNSTINKVLSKLSKSSVGDELAEPNEDGAVHRVKKFRYVDPLFRYGNGKILMRLTDVDEEYREILAEAREYTAKGMWLKAQ